MLETDDTYRVPVVEDDETGITYSSLPSDCDCGNDLYITEEDGDAVDQSAIGFSLNLDDLEQVALLVWERS